MNRRKFFKSIGIPALFLPFIKLFGLSNIKNSISDKNPTFNFQGFTEKCPNCDEEPINGYYDFYNWYFEFSCPFCKWHSSSNFGNNGKIDRKKEFKKIIYKAASENCKVYSKYIS